MKKYVKPMVEVVNLKSSNDIATSFSKLRGTFTRNYLLGNGNTHHEYAVSVYSNVNSADLQNGSTPLEG